MANSLRLAGVARWRHLLAHPAAAAGAGALWGLVCPLPAAAELEVVYTGEGWRNTRGGLERGERYLDNLDVVASAESAELAWLGTVDLRLHLLYNNSARLADELVGDLQSVSNIDAPEALRVFEAWMQKSFGGERSLRFGLYDLNSEFDAIETGALFINSSHGIGPDFSQSGANGPSIFPVTGLALRAEMPVSGNLRLRVVALDAKPGDPDSPGSHAVQLGDGGGALLVAELDGRLGGDAARAFAGAWLYTRETTTLLADTQASDSSRSRAAGAYAALDGALGDRVRAFARLGIATESVHVIGRYAGAGVTWQPGPADGPTLGFAVGHARTSDEYRVLRAADGDATDSAETVLEVTARLPLRSGFTLQPDVQYVVNPGADPDLADALLVGLRVEWVW